MPTPEALTTEGGEACPICRAEATTGAVFPEYQLFGCDNCGCWSSSALASFRSAVSKPSMNQAWSDTPLIEAGCQR